MYISQKVTALRKGGDLDGAEQLALSEFKKNKNDRYIQDAYGWVIYFRLKETAEGLEKNTIQPDKAASQLNMYVTKYAQLKLVAKPNLLHSLILQKVLKIHNKIDKYWHRFLGFARWWDVNNFRAEDYEPFTAKDGKEIDCLSIRFFYGIGRVITRYYSKNNKDDQLWGETQLESALKQQPDNLWFHYYNSKLLLLKGDPKAARQSLMFVIKKRKQAYWVWMHLGDILSNNDCEQAILCYQHAIYLSNMPESVVKVREQLAKLLALGGRYPEAVVQVNMALDEREKQGSKNIPDSLSQLRNAGWYQKYSTGDLPKETNVSALVDVILYQDADLVYRLGVVDNQNQKKELAHVSLEPDKGVVMKYKQFVGIQDIQVGSIVSVAFEEGKYYPVKWQPSEHKVIDNLFQDFEGVLEQPAERAFGFICTKSGISIFVPPLLMSGIKHNGCENIQCKAILSMDKKKGEIGWKALVINKV